MLVEVLAERFAVAALGGLAVAVPLAGALVVPLLRRRKGAAPSESGGPPPPAASSLRSPKERAAVEGRPEYLEDDPPDAARNAPTAALAPDHEPPADLDALLVQLDELSQQIRRRPVIADPPLPDVEEGRPGEGDR